MERITRSAITKDYETTSVFTVPAPQRRLRMSEPENKANSNPIYPYRRGNKANLKKEYGKQKTEYRRQKMEDRGLHASVGTDDRRRTGDG